MKMKSWNRSASFALPVAYVGLTARHHLAFPPWRLPSALTRSLVYSSQENTRVPNVNHQALFSIVYPSNPTFMLFSLHATAFVSTRLVLGVASQPVQPISIHSPSLSYSATEVTVCPCPVSSLLKSQSRS